MTAIVTKVKPAKNVKEVLIAARWILAHVGWCQGEFTNLNGYKKPVAFCSIGAVRNINVTHQGLIHEARLLLEKEVGLFPGNYSTVDGSIFNWNDANGRTKRQVLALFDKVIKKL